MKFCPSCGGSLDRNAAFCSKCGTSLSEYRRASGAPAEPSAAPAPPAPAQPPAATEEPAPVMGPGAGSPMGQAGAAGPPAGPPMGAYPPAGPPAAAGPPAPAPMGQPSPVTAGPPAGPPMGAYPPAGHPAGNPLGRLAGRLTGTRAALWKGGAAAVVGIVVLVGILSAMSGSGSGSRRAMASSVAPSGQGWGRSPNVFVEEPGFFGKLLGQEPRLSVTVVEGTALELQLRTPLSTRTAQSGDTFEAVLTAPILVQGYEAFAAGAPVRGHVSHAARSAKVKGRAELTLEIDSIMASNGEEILVDVDHLHFKARATKKRDAAKIGAASGVGALVGALIGGKKGAAIGAGSGAGAGTGAVLSTRGQEVVLSAGLPVRVTLRRSVMVQIP